MDILIIGAGLSGATIANKFANAGKKVLVLEKRKQIAGNIYDGNVDNVLVHLYGPHIFHTDIESVNEFMNGFWKLNGYKNVVKGEVEDEVVSLPFNFEGIDKFWPAEADNIKALLIKEYGQDARVSINELLKNENEIVNEIAEFVFKNIFENYTSKMWGVEPKKIDRSVLDRVPVVMGYAVRYFSSKYEGIPIDGYTNAVKRMLDHENITVELEKDAVDVLDVKGECLMFNNEKIDCPVIYTGAIDELFGFSFGELAYRSLDIKFETKNVTQFQKMSVLNMPAHPRVTRIVEYKNMTNQKIDGVTVISREMPGEYKRSDKRFGTPYYPMANDESREKYGKYAEYASKYSNLHFVGRLATFKYLDMDKTIAAALDKAKELLG